jgi:hypothetical protein
MESKYFPGVDKKILILTAGLAAHVKSLEADNCIEKLQKEFSAKQRKRW